MAHGKTTDGNSAAEAEFDYVVVGAGSAGCLLANRLSADPANRVLLLEAGKSDRYPWIHIPVGYLYCIGNPRTDWMYATEPDAGLNGRTLRYPRGKVLGGCSSINGMIYMRGQARDYDAWAELAGDAAWVWEHCLKAFRAHEDHYRRDACEAAPDDPGRGNQRLEDLHGSGGELRVERQRLRWDILDAFAQAARQAGVPETRDFNTGDNEGVGYFDVTQRGGLRWSSARAFLSPARKRPNLTIWTEAQVLALDLRPGPDGALRCHGADLRHKGRRVRVAARHETILSAGAIGSPQILQLSGIGPAAALKAAGITPRLDRAGVGHNLQDHLQIRAVFRVENTRTLNTLAATWHGKAMFGLEYLLRRSGPMSMAPSQLGAFTRSDPAQAHCNLEYHVQPLSLDAFGEPLHDFPAFTASVCNLNPASRGTVMVAAPDPDMAPKIAPNYLSAPEDRVIAAQSLRQVREIVAQPALAPFNPVEWKPGPQYESDADLTRLAGDIATTIFHPVGTTAMGRAEDPASVVDSRLRVIGVAGLRVADAGVMPRITSGNTNAPTMMIAERAAEFILADRARG